MKKTVYRLGVDVLVNEYASALDGKRFGLIAHPASIDASGCPSAVRLRARFGDGLAALFSPEHGFFGIAAAGEKVDSVRHPSWGIPVYSLYGETRRPNRAMLDGLDALVFDLQDLSIRCYTYVSTLRYILEAAAERGLSVIVCDRPNPLAGIVDGPVLDPRFESFVGNFPGPLVYGLTSGHAARHLQRALKLKMDLTVMPSHGGAATGHMWISPSPAIRNPHTAWCYPVTVGFEALPIIDYGRPTLMPFELIGTPNINENELAERLAAESLAGIAFHPVVYESKGTIHHGVRIAVTNPSQYRPVTSAVAVLQVLQQMIGKNKLWKTKGSRPAFFDQLFGTDAVRKALQSDVPWKIIAKSWQRDQNRWKLKVDC
jgi:uncharacterized protein YbbC (DUF1343 family)